MLEAGVSSAWLSIAPLPQGLVGLRVVTFNNIPLLLGELSQHSLLTLTLLKGDRLRTGSSCLQYFN